MFSFQNPLFFFFSSRRRHTRLTCDWSSDVCPSDLMQALLPRLADPSSEDVLRGDRPCYRVYACGGGGAIALGALDPKFWERFCAAVGRPEWEGQQFDPLLSPAL